VSGSSQLRRLLRNGGSAVGCFVKLGVREAIDAVKGSGFDFALIDFEHSQLGEETARGLAAHAHALGLPTVVRMPALDPPVINRFLEAGVSGIQLSMLRSNAQRDGLTAATRYSPHGTRSLSTAHPMAGYGSVPVREYLDDQASDPPLLVGQIETAATVDPLTEIVAGLDVVFAGTADLSADMGHPGDPAHSDVQARLSDMAAAASAADAAFGGWIGTAPALPVLTAGGATYIVVGSDLQILRGGLESLATEVRAMLGA
jgi:4-hydroxy-2-oxoheptanedioate aldolase